MAFAFKASGGTAVSTTLNQTAITLTTTTAGAVGDLAVLVYAVDNNATGDGDENAVTSVVCGTGNVWIKAKEFTNGQAAIQAGATCGMWFCNLFKPQPVGTVITVSFGDPPARDASAMSLSYFTESVNFTGVVEATASLANDGAAAGSLNATTSNIACLRIRATASESNSTVVWTKTAVFDGLFAQAVTNSGGGAVNQGIRAEYDVSTGTSLASLPTGGAGGATDHASIYAAFREVPTQFLTPSLYDDVATVFPPDEMSYYFLSGYVADGDAVYATGLATTYSVLGYQTYSDSDNFIVPDVVRGDVVVAAGPVIDAEEIFSTLVIPNARSEIEIVEDEDIFHAPDVATIWIVFDAYVDADDFTTDTLVTSIWYIRHRGGFSLEDIIEPTVLSQTQAISSGMDDADHFFDSGALSQSGADPGFHGSDDQFFFSTFSVDFDLTPTRIDDSAVFHVPVLVGAGVAQALHPVTHIDVDFIRSPIIARGAVSVSTPLYADTDHLIPPFIGRRRTQVRSGVGVIEGTMGNNISLIGHRDRNAA